MLTRNEGPVERAVRRVMGAGLLFTATTST
jgi:hypothetical protein